MARASEEAIQHANELVKSTSAALKLISDPARLIIISLLATAGEDGMTITSMAPHLGLAQPTVSHHIKKLREGGVIEGEKDGPFTIWRLVPGTFSGLADGLRVLAPAKNARKR